MSKKGRALEKQKKQNSPKAKVKQAKKSYYASYEAKQKWAEKKEKKAQKKFDTFGK